MPQTPPRENRYLSPRIPPLIAVWSPAMSVHPIPYSDPLAAFAPFAGQDGAILLDSAAAAGGRGRWTYLCIHPLERSVDPADPFAALSEALRPLSPMPPDDDTLPPFRGGVAGWLGYEVGRHLETLPVPRPDDLGVAEAAFGVYPAVAAFDTERRRAMVVGLPGFEQESAALAAQLSAPAAALPPIATATVPMRAELSRTEAAARIQQVIDYIYAGDIFQANWTQRFLADRLPDGVTPLDLYRRLRALSPAPFAACLSFGGAHILSASPERFLRVDPDGRVESRPIKGTRPRGQTPDDDARLAADLCASEKDRAENLMIVDLLRNDLSRVSQIGSVRVPVLNGLESFATVHHLVSVVESRLRPEDSAVSLLRASFPGGSITGAPKIHAMELIHALEPARRGPYCGSVFWMGPDGAFDSSIIIRTLVIGRSGRIAAQAGGGIVADSDPMAEVDEALTKARAMIRAVSGQDTPLPPET